nr:hypothetical protein [uncultured Porphyromonas sp.]
MNLAQIISIIGSGLICILLSLLSDSFGFCLLWLIGLTVYSLLLAYHLYQELEELKHKRTDRPRAIDSHDPHMERRLK